MVAVLKLVAGMMLALHTAGAWAQPVPIVAAENVYGDIAKQIGGADVSVTSILSNPDQDPHLFEASPAVARNLANAKVVIVNGAAYDPWAEKLLAANRASGRTVIVVADLMGRKPGDNPHLWYHPPTMTALAKALAQALSTANPAHAADYEDRAARFIVSMEPVYAKLQALQSRLNGTPVTATEPVFGYVFDWLHLTVRNERFQLAVMNNTEPAASDVAAFEQDLRTRRVKLLVYNSQATDPVAARMRRIAVASHVPVVAVTETEPAGKTYQTWMMEELDAVDRALPH